jgi:hypothetical protein
LVKELGIPLTSFSEIESIDIAIDGADEVNSDLELIKAISTLKIDCRSSPFSSTNVCVSSIILY